MYCIIILVTNSQAVVKIYTLILLFAWSIVSGHNNTMNYHILPIIPSLPSPVSHPLILHGYNHGNDFSLWSENHGLLLQCEHGYFIYS